MSKKLWITTTLVVAAVGATAIVAHADRGNRGPGGHGHHGYHGGYNDGGHHRGGRHRRGGREMTKADFDAKTRSRFAKWDTNSDGVVDQTEVEARMSSRMERRMGRRDGRRWSRMLRRFDPNSDGKVTRAEIEAHVTKRFERMDLDGDGKITDADLPPMLRGMNVLAGGDAMDPHFGRHHRHHQGGRGGKRGHRMMRHLIGADTNKDGEVSVQEMQDRAATRFARYDRNSDGVIDEADRDALGKEMLDYRVKRFLHRFGATDGKLTMEQFTTYRNERFARRDRNGDGTIGRGDRRGGGEGRNRGRRGGGEDDRGRGDEGEGRRGDREGGRPDRD